MNTNLNNLENDVLENNFILVVPHDLFVPAAKQIGAGIATVGLVGSAAGAGLIFGALIVSSGQSPETDSALFRIALLGFALTEAVGLLGLMVSFLILFG
jgi:F0F1-type ATP synthase membrane subunit c/vacuolar-type H+-ATPase subunit K